MNTDKKHVSIEYKNMAAVRQKRSRPGYGRIIYSFHVFIRKTEHLVTIPREMAAVHLTIMLCHLKSAQITAKHCLVGLYNNQG